MGSTSVRVVTYAVMLVAVMLLVACAGSAPMSPPPAGATQPTKGPRFWEATDEEYAVYAALLRQLFVEHRYAFGPQEACPSATDPATNQIVLCARTLDPRLDEEGDELVGDDLLSVPYTLPGCPPDLAAQFRAVNLKPARLDVTRLRVSGLAISLQPQAYYDRPWAPNHNFYRGHPRNPGATLLSRVAFSRTGDLALVSTNTMRTTTFGHGEMYLLRKGPDGWRIIAYVNTWIS